MINFTKQVCSNFEISFNVFILTEEDSNKPIKSILKKTSTSSTTNSSQNGTKKEAKKVSSTSTIRKVSKVNYAFESDDEDDLRKNNSVKIVAEVH